MQQGQAKRFIFNQVTWLAIDSNGSVTNGADEANSDKFESQQVLVVVVK